MSTSTSESEVEETESENSENEPIDKTSNSEDDEDKNVVSSDDDDGSEMEGIENFESAQEINESGDTDNSEQEDEESDDEKMKEDNAKISNHKKQDVSKARQIESSYQEQKMVKDPEPIPLLSRPNAASQFRNYYMSQITKAFGEDLDRIRKDQNLDSNRLEILIDSLESGISIFSDVEKELALLSHNNK